MKKLPVALVDEESKPNPTVIGRFSTIDEAVEEINRLEKTQPEKVHRGGFGIDAPEEMLS
jgi:hypothetical protein